MKNKTNDGHFELKFENPVTKPRIAKALAAVTLIGITSVSTYLFADNYTLNFRSPVILQNPVVVESRIMEEIKEASPSVEVKESTPSAVVEEVSFQPSDRMVAHTAQQPGIYSKIKQYFGDDSLVMGEIISRESSLNPYAVNPSSGAIGLFQRYPANTLLDDCPDLSDIDCQMKNGKKYIEDRYGDTKTALAFWDENGWY